MTIIANVYVYEYGKTYYLWIKLDTENDIIEAPMHVINAYSFIVEVYTIIRALSQNGQTFFEGILWSGSLSYISK